MGHELVQRGGGKEYKLSEEVVKRGQMQQQQGILPQRTRRSPCEAACWCSASMFTARALLTNPLCTLNSRPQPSCIATLTTRPADLPKSSGMVATWISWSVDLHERQAREALKAGPACVQDKGSTVRND